MKSSEFITINEFNENTLIWAKINNILDDLTLLAKDLNAIETGLFNNKIDDISKTGIKNELDNRRAKLVDILYGFMQKDEYKDKHLISSIQYLDEIITKL